MASYKRKRDDDSDDDEPSFGRQILPVANLPEDFDGIPCDGLQYLFTVRRDARCLPHITRAANPYKIDSPPPPAEDTRVVPGNTVLPSEQWRTIYGKRFKNFRGNTKQPTINVQFNLQRERRLMPDKKERDLWWAYLSGKPEVDWNPPKKSKHHQNNKKRQFGYGMRGFTDDLDCDLPVERKRQESWQTNDEGEVELVLKVDPSESLPTPTGSPAPLDASDDLHPPGSSTITSEVLESTIYKPREPTPSLLRHIDERMALHLLMYFTHWINVHLEHPTPSSGIIESHARWIFVLLSRVEDQISADDMSLLRNLARACLSLLRVLIQERSTPPASEESVKPGLEENSGGFISERSCWIILATIVGVWAQRDLWMDAEDMLKTLGP